MNLTPAHALSRTKVRIHVLWDVTPCFWVRGVIHFRVTQRQFFLDFLTLEDVGTMFI